MTDLPRAVRHWRTPAGLAVREAQPAQRPDGSQPSPHRIVLVHGAMDRGASFRRIERALPDATVLSYDRRGYAESLGVPPSADFDDHVADLVSVLGESPAAVFGHSFGGVLALTLAARRPDLVSAAAVFEPPFPWFEWWPPSHTQRTAEAHGPEAAAESFLRRFLGERIWNRLPESHRQQRRQEGAALVADMAALRSGQRPFDPALVCVPLVLGQGEKSLAIYGRGIDEFCGTMRGEARWESHVVPGAQHGGHLSHPRELADLVRRAGALRAT